MILALLAVGAGYVPDLSEAVVYEANLRAFEPHAGFDGVTQAIWRIKALGANVLWLMPVQPVGKLRSAGGIGSPYATSDFDALNPEFGNEESFRGLVEAAHKRKMAVILDWAADHTSWDSVWIKAHPGWFLRDSKGAISIPPGTGWNDVAALDYKNAEMRSAMIASMKGWISKYNIDGFRCDSADRMPFDFWKTAISTLRASTSKRLLMLAEGYRADDYAAGFDLTYGWHFCSGLRNAFGGRSAREIGAAAIDEQEEIPAGARRLRFITNHDISAWEASTLEMYKSDQGSRTAFALAALYGGTPLIYTGEEVGWGKRIPIFGDSEIDWKDDAGDSVWMADLLKLRVQNPALRSGVGSDLSSQNVVLFTRVRGSHEAIVAANVRSQPETVSVPKGYQGSWRNGLTGQTSTLGTELSLPPYGCFVYTRKRDSRSTH